MPTPDPAPAAGRRWLIPLAVLPPALALAWLGNDASWDTRNYHLYGPHAWLHGRDALDVAAAQMQGYHNPLLDLPAYALASAGAPSKLVGLWLALPAMFALWCLLRLQERLSPAPPSFGERIVLVLLALSGAALWSTLGLAMDDAFVAAGMLGSLLLLLDHAEASPSPSRVFFAGLLAGATAGLKLSGAFYCPVMAIALLLLPGSARERIARLACLAVGGLLGIALSYGWWGWHLWRNFANPFFPYFNQLFHSPWIAANSWVDERFRPQGALDVLLSPWRLAWRSRRFSEAGMKDPRMLLAIFGFAWLAWRRRPNHKMRAMLAFVLAAWLGWAWQSGIYRYAIVLELLGALALALLLAQVPRGRVQLVAMALAVLLVSVGTRRPDWQRAPTGDPMFPALADGARLPADALVVTASDQPLGYVALALPDSVPMIGLDNNLIHPGDCTLLPERAERELARHRGPIYLATNGSPESLAARRRHGLGDAPGPCLRVVSGLGEARLCPLDRIAPPVGTCPGP